MRRLRMTVTWTALRAAAAALAAAACLSAGLAGCSQGNGSTLTAPCAVIEDASPSANSFNAATSLKERLPAFLLDNKCQHVLFVPLTYSSRDSACDQPSVDISGADQTSAGDVDQASLEAGRRAYAVKQAQAVLACAQKEQQKQMSTGGTDVLGALARAASERPAGTGTYYVLVVSDLIQNTANADLYHQDLRTATSRTKLITSLIFKGLVPDMSGMDLEITDFGRDLSVG